MEIQEYITSECDRQHATNYEDMQTAFDFAESFSVSEKHNFPRFVMSIANLVDPNVNTFDFRRGLLNIRTSEVGFATGGSASKAIDVKHHFFRWTELYVYAINPEHIEIFIKQFLDIHPFADGNGRTASILRNWMLGTMHDPQPLPYYYGDQ